MKAQGQISRRNVLRLAAGGAALPLVHIRTVRAAGSLRLAFLDHWVPAANPVMRRLVWEWAAKNKVDVTLDLLSGGTANSAILLAQATESQAGTGHDVMEFGGWHVQQYHRHLEPVDDLMQGLITQYGAVDPIAEYLAKVRGHWMATPVGVMSQYKSSCGRISFFKEAGYDLREWYPNHPGDAESAAPWTYDLMLKLAPQAQREGMPFALGLGMTTDSIDWVGALLRAYGAVLVDDRGRMHLRSDAVQQVLEYLQNLYPYLPEDAAVYDDASNNKALIAGKTALIFNPPSAWWVARRDAPAVAADCWTFPSPAGPKGRFNPYLPAFWGVWSFSQNKSAAKDLLAWLQQRPQVEALCDASDGYDIPPFLSMHDFKIWETVGPPAGTVYNYPIRPWHDTQANMTAYPAPPHIAVQIYNNAIFNVMVVKLARNKENMKDVLDWAEKEINGYVNM